MSRSQYLRLFKSVLDEGRYDGRIIRVEIPLICRKGANGVVYVQVKQGSAQVQPETLQRACYDEAMWSAAKMFETSVTGGTVLCLAGSLENCGRVLLISNFRRVLYVVCFLLGNSPVSEFYMPTFRSTLSVPSS
jgi:hypothetical protein